MNKKLRELYASKWENLSGAMLPIPANSEVAIHPTNPLLLSIKNEEDFVTSDLRVMIFGQETNNWFDKFNGDMGAVLDTYDRFFNSGECWAYGGQFWNGINRLRKLLKKKYPEKNIRFLWNNVVKIGKYRAIGFPSNEIHKVECDTFNVIKEEINIVKPDIIVFLSGPNYDHIIKAKIPEVEFLDVDGFSKRQLSRLAIEGVPFAFRTYHPNYLWRNDIDKYFNAVIGMLD